MSVEFFRPPCSRLNRTLSGSLSQTRIWSNVASLVAIQALDERSAFVRAQARSVRAARSSNRRLLTSWRMRNCAVRAAAGIASPRLQFATPHNRPGPVHLALEEDQAMDSVLVREA